jgi:hypothetical protein
MVPRPTTPTLVNSRATTGLPWIDAAANDMNGR